MRDECIGIPPRFECEFCPSKFRRKYHLVRHLNARHSDIVGVYGSGIIVNGRDGKKLQLPPQQPNDAPQPTQLKIPLSTIIDKDENIAANAAKSSPVSSSATDFAMNLAKDFSVDAIMQMKREQSAAEFAVNLAKDLSEMKGEQCDTPTMSGPGLKLIEELQRKIGFQMNSELFTSLRQMNPLKY